ncbi:MAG: leucine-rich repeat domain-containing protein [Prevotella sp.]|nr:leucine-rich repeat domain-containing protein [Prevotella sp.]
MKTENKSKEFFTRAAMTLLVMIICPLGMSAQEILTDGDWNFKVTAGVATLVGYRGSATVITTPATVGGYTVRAIGGYCFTNNPTSITVSEGVMEIDDRAFGSCSNLTNVSLPTTLTSLGAYAFRNCSSLSAINLPSGLTHIYEYTFYGCSSLGSITIPSTVTVIGTGAFSGCSSLSSVSIPAGMIQIESSAFSGCSSLSSITIPAGVTLIENSTFLNCSSLSSVTILGNVTSIEKQAFYGCSNLKSISVPASLYKIGNYAFSDSGLADFWFNGTVAQWNNVDVDANAFYRTSPSFTITAWSHTTCRVTARHLLRSRYGLMWPTW